MFLLVVGCLDPGGLFGNGDGETGENSVATYVTFDLNGRR